MSVRAQGPVCRHLFYLSFPGPTQTTTFTCERAQIIFAVKIEKCATDRFFLFGGGRGALLTRREIESESLPRHKYMFTHTHTHTQKQKI